MSEVDYLVDDVDLTTRLLDEPLEWRVRAVDELLVDAATSCRHRRSLHCAPLGGLLPESAYEVAFVALPLCSVPRGPLLDFDVEGPLGNAWLLPRLDIAARQVRFLTELGSRSGLAFSPDLIALMEALVGFSDGSSFDSEGRPKGTIEFLTDGLGHSLPADVLKDLSRSHFEASSLLRPLSEGRGAGTAPERPALGIPQLVASGAMSLEAAVQAVVEYCSVLRSISLRAHQEEAAVDAQVFLDVLADYGHTFELIVATKVPVNEPFTVKFEERRSLELTAWRNRGAQSLVVFDAQTNHVTFRVDDANVRIAECEPRSAVDGDRPVYGAVVSRGDPQTRSYYCYDEDREYRMSLDFRLTLLRRLMLVPYLIAALLYFLAGALLTADVEGLRDVTLIATPATIAAGVLAVRESSSLGSRLRLLNTTLVALGLACMLMAAAWQLSPFEFQDILQR